MVVNLSSLAGAGWQFFDNSGNPLSGGLLYTYQSGSTTPQETYTTVIGNVQNTNPIVLDSAGRTPQEIWLLNGYSYKFVLKNSNAVLIGTYDNIPGTSSNLPIINNAASVAYEQGASTIAGKFIIGRTYLITSIGTTNFITIGAASNTVNTYFTATGIGSGTGTAQLSQSVQTVLRQSVSVMDFGATGNGSTDDTAAIQAAIDYLRLLYNPANSNRPANGVLSQSPYKLYFPAGKYLVSTPLVFDYSVAIVGATEGHFSQFATEILFTNTTAGFVFLWSLTNAFPVYNAATNTVTSISPTAGTPGQILAGSPAIGTANFSSITNLVITGTGKTGNYVNALSGFSGIESRVVLNLSNVWIWGFNGCGIRIFGAGGGNPNPTGAFNINTWGGADGWNFQSASAGNCDGHGFFCYGGDTNIGVQTMCQYTSCEGWGLYDNSGLGNAYIGGQASENQGNGFADFLGSISGDVLTVTDIPYSDAERNIYIGIGHSVKGTGVTGGTTVSYQISGALGGVGTYKLSASSTVSSKYLYTRNPNGGSWGCFYGTGKNLFLNLYAENGVKHIGRDSLHINGISNGGVEGFLANRPAALGISGGVSESNAASIVGAGGQVIQSPTNIQLTTSTGLTTGINFMTAPHQFWQASDPTYMPSGATWGFEFSSTFPNAQGDSLVLYFNNEAFAPFWISGPTTTNTYGTTAPIIGQLTASSIALPSNRISQSSAAPSSGNYAKGDMIFNSNPSAGGNAGWICVTTGTPGTWKTFGTIAA